MVVLLSVAVLIAVVDQILKHLVKVFIPLGNSLDTFLPFLKITNIHNTGAAFGSLGGMRLYLIISSVFIIAFIGYYVFKKKIKNRLLLIFLAFVMGGGWSNLYDRIFYGFVTDYIKLSFFSPICNLGDYFICFGTIAILVLVLRYKNYIN